MPTATPVLTPLDIDSRVIALLLACTDPQGRLAARADSDAYRTDAPVFASALRNGASPDDVHGLLVDEATRHDAAALFVDAAFAWWHSRP